MDNWRTGITTHDDDGIWYCGHDVAGLMRTESFAGTTFLLHHGRLPNDGERRLFEAILVGIADHGPGSPSAMSARTVATGNRVAPEAAVAAGILAIGDAHGGAGWACQRLLMLAIDRAARDGVSDDIAAEDVVREECAAGRRLPGFGHRTHSQDPRTAVLLLMAEELGVAGAGVRMVRAFERAVARQVKPLPINVDAAMAAVLCDMGFPPVVAKLMFIVGRAAGLSAEVLEEYTRERPMRVKVPVVYDGPAPRRS
ncbi:MAG: citryl-CoA lyase [Acidobacteria bacterium]|nr:citryl-CoA lyase [Acidobacteriota bacterium]MBP8273216.1 citryl-CoA lyase [Acidobacteriota bacterium]